MARFASRNASSTTGSSSSCDARSIRRPPASRAAAASPPRRPAGPSSGGRALLRQSTRDSAAVIGASFVRSVAASSASRQRLHPELDAGISFGLDALDFRLRHPGRRHARAATAPTDARVDVPWPTRVLHHVAILQVRDALVRVVAARGRADSAAARTAGRPRRSGWPETRTSCPSAPRGPRSASRRLTRNTDTARVPAGRPLSSSGRRTARTDVTISRPSLSGTGSTGFCALSPARRTTTVSSRSRRSHSTSAGAHFTRRVVAPARGDAQLGRVRRHQHADADGRGELAAAGGRRFVLVVVLVRSRGRLAESQLPCVSSSSCFWRRVRPRDEKAGEVPARGRNVEQSR